MSPVVAYPVLTPREASPTEQWSCTGNFFIYMNVKRRTIIFIKTYVRLPHFPDIPFRIHGYGKRTSVINMDYQGTILGTRLSLSLPVYRVEDDTNFIELFRM